MATLLQSRVDWDLVDEELDRVPEEFKDQGFDSLRHVLDILSAVDADAALEEVKPSGQGFVILAPSSILTMLDRQVQILQIKDCTAIL